MMNIVFRFLLAHLCCCSKCSVVSLSLLSSSLFTVFFFFLVMIFPTNTHTHKTRSFKVGPSELSRLGLLLLLLPPNREMIKVGAFLTHDVCTHPSISTSFCTRFRGSGAGTGGRSRFSFVSTIYVVVFYVFLLFRCRRVVVVVVLIVSRSI